MRKSFLLWLGLAVVLSASAWADPVPIGLLSFDQPLGSVFDITNNTGNGADPIGGFPVLTGLTLTGTLTLTGDCGTNCVFSDVVLGPGGLFESPGFDTSLNFTSATFAGTLGPTTSVTVSGEANPVFLAGTFSATLTDTAGSLAPGDTVAIYANTIPAPVPEPGTLLLLASGLAGEIARRARNWLRRL